jgi:hypothetical protein
VSNNLGKWILVIVLVGIIILLLYSFLSRRLGGANAPSPTTVEVNLQDLIPDSWVIQSGMGPTECDFDGDGANEQLAVYRYNRYSQDQVGGQLGAVIFDSQVNSATPGPGAQSPYRPTLLVPYLLLPDFFNNKGQGYLGEETAMVYAIAGEARGQEGCRADEINVVGTTANSANLGQPNFLSIFRWGGLEKGYVGPHFAGNARIAIKDGAEKPITELTTYNRLNDRSVLCAAQTYVRSPAALDFLPSNSTIDFCFGAPPDPFYPEGVVVAFLRGANPPADQSPTGANYFTASGAAALDALGLGNLAQPQRDPAPIFSVTNRGALALPPQEGNPCLNQGLATPEGSSGWWCGSERATVATETTVNGQTRQLVWTLVSIAQQNVVDDIHWRIDAVADQ